MYRLTLRVGGEPTDGPEVTGDTERAPGLKARRRQRTERVRGFPEGAGPQVTGLDLRGRSGANREVVRGMGAGILVLPGGLCSWFPAVASHARATYSPTPAHPLATLRHRGLSQCPGTDGWDSFE